MNAYSKGAVIAASAALFAIASAASADGPAQKVVNAGDMVSCYGINACKGQSECKTASNACKGLNQCKGHGFKTVTAKACLVQGGTILL